MIDMVNSVLKIHKELVNLVIYHIVNHVVVNVAFVEDLEYLVVDLMFPHHCQEEEQEHHHHFHQNLEEDHLHFRLHHFHQNLEEHFLKVRLDVRLDAPLVKHFHHFQVKDLYHHHLYHLEMLVQKDVEQKE